MLVLDGKIINCYKDENSKSGYVVTATSNGVTKPCWINCKSNQEKYWRVYLGNSYDAKYNRVSFYYLHKIIFATQMGWDRLDIAPDCHIHHLNHSPGIKNNPALYNDITNLIYLPSKEHAQIHALEKRAKFLTEKPYETMEERQNNVLSSIRCEQKISAIINKYVAIRDNTRKKFLEGQKKLDKDEEVL